MNLESITKEVMARLKSNYDSTKTPQINELLKAIKPVVLTNKGINTMQGYYALNDEKMAEVAAKPRNISYFFDPGEPGEYIPNLEAKGTIQFYVKSSSRFFLKPDIGEVFDQMTDEQRATITAVCIVRGSQIEVDNGNGDHFLMDVQLLAPKAE